MTASRALAASADVYPIVLSGFPGATCVASSPEQFAQFVKTEQVKWGDIVRKSGAKID